MAITGKALQPGTLHVNNYFMNKEFHLVLDCVSCVVFPLCGYFLGARTSPLWIFLPYIALGGIRAKVVLECVDKSSKLRQFAPGSWEDMQMDLWL